MQAHPRRTTLGRAGTFVRYTQARLAAVCVLVAVTSACGSAGHSPPTPAVGQPSTGSAPSTAAAAHSSAPGGPPAPRTGTDRASSQQLCHAISLNLSVLTKAAQSPNDPSLPESIALIRRLRDTASADIKDDLQVIADFDDKLLTAARSGASPDGIAETPRLTQALAHEASWTAAHCPR